jgi:hypothetical protein
MWPNKSAADGGPSEIPELATGSSRHSVKRLGRFVYRK